MTRDEHKHLRHLRGQWVDMVDAVAQKIVRNNPSGISLEELVSTRDGIHEMLEVFQLEMIEKYRLNPLVTEHMTPKPTLK